ncbi:MAG TPA: protein-disulfide reductase DsbD domain-containing protein [Pseudolabrys sp.]|nr:protein-disulfide reductase DsbD domain-containing protein [Pseudolabrys sp.]
MTFLQHSMRVTLASCGAVVLYGNISAHAADASPWVDDLRSAVRLIAGAPSANTMRAGIQIKLQPGWHTYWRYPGDSGVPPRFSFDGSDNVAKATVMFPAPHAYIDETGTTLGYKEGVVFPVQVTPKQPGKPATLRMKIDYAVCEKLCVPVEAQTELMLDNNKRNDPAVLSAAEARVPKPLSAAQADLKVKRVNGAGAKPHVLVDLPAPRGGDIHVFVEGPTPEWALPIPKPAQGAPAGRAYFTFDLDGLPPGADPRKPVDLTFTVERGGKAAEVRTHLD